MDREDLSVITPYAKLSCEGNKRTKSLRFDTLRSTSSSPQAITAIMEATMKRFADS